MCSFKIKEMLSNQRDPETKERFKDLKDGDVLKLKAVEDMIYATNIYCSFTSEMRQYAHQFTRFVFKEDEWSKNGYIRIGGYNYSLDMFLYGIDYNVSII